MTGWTVGEKHLVANAAAHAPSVHNTAPWVLDFSDDPRQVSLSERLDRALLQHDPLGRDRRISCGAVLEHVRLAVGVLGWTPELDLYPNPARPEEVARVTVTGHRAPSEVELSRYGAIAGRRSHRKPFAARPTEDEIRGLLGAQHVAGVGLRLVAGDELTVLAKLLHHTALVLRADDAYQRELSAWTAPVRDPLPGEGVSAATRRVTTLPWAGLVRRTTAVPDVATLADRLRGELLVVVETPDDGPRDQVRAGMAAEAVWLAAADVGLAGSVLTQPFQLSEVRAGLVESLSLNGFPQLLLRFGHPTDYREER